MTMAIDTISADRLRSLVERIERLQAERKTLAGDIKDIMAEAKGAGFDGKVIRQIIRQLRPLGRDGGEPFG